MSTGFKIGKKLSRHLEKPGIQAISFIAAMTGFREKDLLELTVLYLNSGSDDKLSGVSETVLRALREIHVQGEPTPEQAKAIFAAAKELQRSGVEFRAATLWLCSLRASKASARLRPQRGASLEWGRYPSIDKVSEGFVKYFESHGLRHLKSHLMLQDGRLLIAPRLIHLVDLFCACVISQCVDRPQSDIALRLCPRCRNFFASARRQFCSTTCQWKHYWTPERRSEDKWIRDLEKFAQRCKPRYARSIVDLQNKLASPRVSGRLKSIKEKIGKDDWAGWTRIAQRIDTIEKLAIL